MKEKNNFEDEKARNFGIKINEYPSEKLRFSENTIRSVMPENDTRHGLDVLCDASVIFEKKENDEYLKECSDYVENKIHYSRSYLCHKNDANRSKDNVYGCFIDSRNPSINEHRHEETFPSNRNLRNFDLNKFDEHLFRKNGKKILIYSNDNLNIKADCKKEYNYDYTSDKNEYMKYRNKRKPYADFGSYNVINSQRFRDQKEEMEEVFRQLIKYDPDFRDVNKNFTHLKKLISNPDIFINRKKRSGFYEMTAEEKKSKHIKSEHMRRDILNNCFMALKEVLPEKFRCNNKKNIILATIRFLLLLRLEFFSRQK
ncbi:hypothetical protein CWI37_0906p0010 [Hamiltosporidium tvaerminnensis]|uniref:BHLH domain-containing protein n=3 Tax=Hamiltosporidium TaxID=1176354 RepID=A0A4Q9LML2_9MICR|nr:hypothetical protein CWI37_0906p0010 [Hamiltosporidium tvaerminnensis]TBU03557.1 hypothetical protein CWI39_0948p0010 [Hamiltosporidium magnivora]TBU09598.1 hypothetical protein CWI36_0016p0050 [Hamiltosporidium magnivora]